jgi:hypothetical protein
MHIFLISWNLFQTLLLVWIGIAVAIFFILLKITAPYGRHTSAKWGPQVSNRLGWFLMEVPVLLVVLFFMLPAAKTLAAPALVMMCLFCLHYIYRSLVFPFRLHTKGKKMPWVIVGSGVLFNLVTGFSLGYYFTHFANYTNEWFTGLRFIAGLLLFVGGMYINWKSDNLLIDLRKANETGYKIPRGWLFDKISCPNLAGELMEWLGFAILCWNLPALTFFIWTAANLVPRALSHHKWYIQMFNDYPAGRKAIIPFVV